MHEDSHPLLERVQTLGASLLQGHLGSPHFLRQLAQLLRQHFRCGQVSVWSLAGQGADQRAACLARDCADGPQGALDDMPQVQGHQAYFDRLRLQGYIASPDTHVDPALHAVRQRYLQGGAPRALLDVAFTVNGQTFGILCCEELARPRPWTTEELMLLRRVGSRVALHLKAHEARASARAPDESPVVSR
jgi:GAF domain-containing protein